MKLDRVKYTRYFKETEEWLGAEIQVEEGDLESDVWKAAFLNVQTAYQIKHGLYNVGPDNRIHPIPPPEPVIRDIQVDRDPPDDHTVLDIMNCTQLDGPGGLLTYRILATTDPKYREAYNMMYQKLSK